ncbi:MAG TPA: glutamate-1-semialdehyde 2,1-aminomutase [Candidatus Bathyarchaeia archaeon]|nr:glutamate-1-semialdehyde 2,1-aminomutase [Candidatus Bathyarchaeia archaeon]
MATRLASRSQELYKRARQVIPGGVNSPVRSYAPYPLFVASAKDARFKTADGQEYLDYCMGYGALLDGHSPQRIIDNVKTALESGTVYAQPTEREVELAELITSLVPSIEMVRLANSGTEATMHAIRLARGFTGRSKIVKFEGSFHGSHDSVLVKAREEGSPVGAPSSPGVPEDVAKNTLVAPYNDENGTEEILRDYEDEIAAVIIEPVMGNVGLIGPNPGFLQSLRRTTAEKDILLIFDEVITGFRLAPGGAQEYFGIRPDLTVLGKILGGGFPLSAFGGRRDIMEKLAPLGPVYQAGTFSGNPVSVAASTEILRSIKKRGPQIYTLLKKRREEIGKGLQDLLISNGRTAQVNSLGSMFQIFFTPRPVVDYKSAKSSNVDSYQHYFQSLLRTGVFVPPSQFETCFLSTSHSKDDVQTTLESFDSALKS